MRQPVKPYADQLDSRRGAAYSSLALHVMRTICPVPGPPLGGNGARSAKDRGQGPTATDGPSPARAPVTILPPASTPAPGAGVASCSTSGPAHQDPCHTGKAGAPSLESVTTSMPPRA